MGHEDSPSRTILREGKSTLTGTYFAEQVSKTCFELKSVSHVEKYKPPGSRQLSSRSGLSVAPGSAGARRRQLQQEDAAKSMALPALSLDSFAGKGSNETDQPEDCGDPGLDLFAKRPVGKAERIRKVSSRLYRGERQRDCCTPTDQQIMATLTKPLSVFPEDVRRDRSQMSPGSSRLSPGSSERKKRYGTYTELFRAGLAGTEWAGLPLNLRNPLGKPRGGRWQPAQMCVTRLVRPPSVEPIPDDAVEAFFMAEEAATGKSLLLREALLPINHSHPKQAAWGRGPVVPPGSAGSTLEETLLSSTAGSTLERPRSEGLHLPQQGMESTTTSTSTWGKLPPAEDLQEVDESPS